MTNIDCESKEGSVKTFRYTMEEDIGGEKWTFRIYNVPPLKTGESVQISVKEFDDETVRVVMMDNFNVPEYKGAGIPDVMIPEIAAILDKKVVSSSNKSCEPGESRNSCGDKVWERLKNKSLAVYDQSEDRYRLV